MNGSLIQFFHYFYGNGERPMVGDIFEAYVVENMDVKFIDTSDWQILRGLSSGGTRKNGFYRMIVGPNGTLNAPKESRAGQDNLKNITSMNFGPKSSHTNWDWNPIYLFDFQFSFNFLHKTQRNRCQLRDFFIIEIGIEQ